MKGVSRWLMLAAVLGTWVGGLVLTGSMAQAQANREDHRGRSPQHMTLSHDKYIGDRVERRLIRSASLAGTAIRVAVENRVVSLTGTVGSEQDKARALQIARRTKGVRNVKDNLRIEQAAVQQRRDVQVTDDALAKQVATTLARETFPLAEAEANWLFGWEVRGPDWEFDVEVDDRMVTLAGTVNTYGDMSDALQAARAVAGVRAVEADLEVNALALYGPPFVHPSDNPR